ncbi:hypothetical protein [Sphingobacterium sp. FBM7-1]|uniref:hypothetical protein n=1 Tax=Sphingobacterium sp. FBM7-1 TaxID=2886688 RepID=UPI001D11A465|nr:hypothetical protein [Sphingobacterium sp. FBM7-1]MCC2599660.1 hypothetical protein [Sphingobacterium sp. FBM7-1]
MNTLTITRKQVFETHPVIASLIADFQQQFFDPEYNDPNDPAYDALALEATPMDYAGNYIITWAHDDIISYPATLTKALQNVLSDLHCDSLLLLASHRYSLYGHPQHDDARILEARDILHSLTGTDTYSEALSVPVVEMERLIAAFFWLSRLDPELPEYIFWVDATGRFAFFICNRGNIHLLVFDEHLPLNDTYLKARGFIVGPDIDQFTQGCPVEGR